MPVRDLIVIGAGPSGLAAAIAAKQHGLDYQVLEQGTLVNSIYRFPPQMVFFTTPELMEIGQLPFVSPYDKPTRAEALRYYRKVVDTYDLQIACDEKVLAIARETDESEPVFAVETLSARGVRRVRHARFVVVAIGYYDHPVRLGVPGEDLPHVSHYQQEPHAYYRKRVVIVGGGNSAAEAALELFRAGAQVTLVHRHEALKPTIKYWVRPDIDNRIREGSIAARFSSEIREIRPTSVVIANAARPDGEAPRLHPERERLRSSARDNEGSVTGEREPSASAGGGAPARGTMSGAASSEEREPTLEPGGHGHEAIPADAVFLLTGYRADVDLMVRAGVELTEREAPRCDPMTFETNVPGLFVAGGAIAGVDTGTVFIENGRFHGVQIVEEIARRA